MRCMWHCDGAASKEVRSDSVNIFVLFGIHYLKAMPIAELISLDHNAKMDIAEQCVTGYPDRDITLCGEYATWKHSTWCWSDC